MGVDAAKTLVVPRYQPMDTEMGVAPQRVLMRQDALGADDPDVRHLGQRGREPGLGLAAPPLPAPGATVEEWQSVVDASMAALWPRRPR